MSSESRAVEEAASSHAELVSVIQRAGLRDEVSFARLYDVVSPIVFGLAVRILANTSAAEDTVVEIFSGIWDHTFRFDPARSSPLVWITTITRARALERLRSDRNGVPMTAALEPPPQPPAEILDFEAWLSEQSNRARGALEALPAELRRAVEMAYFEGLTPEEIAQRLLASPDMIRTRIRLGMTQLREALGPVLREGRPRGRD